MFSIILRKADQTRCYSVSALSEAGWRVTSEREGKPPRQVCYHDWHRVERALAIFQREVSELTALGWREVH